MSNEKKIKIEKGMPLPPIGKGRPYGTTKYPWMEMEVGDRFHVPVKKDGNMVIRQSSIRSLAREWAKKNGIVREFVTRRIDGKIYIYRTL